MQIHDYNTLNFQSRNKTIRFADDIARHVNKCYPRVSNTKLSFFKNAKHFKKNLKILAKNIDNNVRSGKSDYYYTSYSFLDKIKSFIKPVKKHKIGNCAESAQLAAITAKINGIKDCQIACLYNTNGEDFDHAVLFVNDKKPYIIDAWLGFADYIPNTIQRYKNEFNYIFDVKPEEKLAFKRTTDDICTNFLNTDFTKEQLDKLRTIYPEQWIKKNL